MLTKFFQEQQMEENIKKWYPKIYLCYSYTWNWDGPRTRCWLWCPAVTGAHLPPPAETIITTPTLTLYNSSVCYLMLVGKQQKYVDAKDLLWTLYVVNFKHELSCQSCWTINSVYIKRPEVLSLMPEICLFSTKAWIMTKSFDNNGLLLDLQSI